MHDQAIVRGRPRRGASGGGAAAAQDKTYHVALDGTFAPHAVPKRSGGIEGFNVDLANEIG